MYHRFCKRKNSSELERLKVISVKTRTQIISSRSYLTGKILFREIFLPGFFELVSLLYLHQVFHLQGWLWSYHGRDLRKLLETIIPWPDVAKNCEYLYKTLILANDLRCLICVKLNILPLWIRLHTCYNLNYHTGKMSRYTWSFRFLDTICLPDSADATSW